MHVPTGLFVTGAYGWRHDGNVKTLLPAANNANKDDSTQWLVQAGIEQNWFGIGRTTLFGEFQQWSVGPGASGPVTPSNGLNLVGTASNGVPSFASARTNMWGIGLNQSIDAAAMDLYVLYHNYNDIHTTDTAGVGTGYKDFQAVMSGAIIKF